MKRLLAYLPGIHDACSYWRGAGPLGALRDPEWNVDFFAIAPEWPSIAQADVVFLQRPHTAECLKVAQVTKIYNRKLWVDFDDLLFDVPPSNPNFHKFATQAARTRIGRICELADVVTFSTADLAEAFLQAGAKINGAVVIANAWSEDHFPRPPRPFKTHKSFFWRGTETHDADLYSVRDGLLAVAERYSDWNFLFVGRPPWQLVKELGGRFQMLAPMPLEQYFSFLRTLECSVALVPLEDSPFNRGKSNIAWQEATYAGCATVAPDFPEWRFPGVVRYSTPATFAAAVDVAVESAASLHALSWESIRKHRPMEIANRVRLDLLNGIVQGLGVKGLVKIEGGMA